MITVRALNEADYDDWLKVYRLYAEHYQMELTNDGISVTWGWLMDTQHPVAGIVAEVDNHIIGLAHFRAMPSPLRGENVGFLDDLIVTPEKRGGEAGKLLLKELQSIGRREKWSVIRWITKDDNYRARSLYDKVATKTDWTMYEMQTDA